MESVSCRGVTEGNLANPRPHLFVLGLNHRSAPVEVRERLAFNNGTLAPALRRLVDTEVVREGTIISTCNRVEIVTCTPDLAIADEKVRTFLAAKAASHITPTVVALRTMATGVVENELQRLAGRLPDLDDAARAEIEHAVRRVADKLLQQPTVRVKELANETGAVSYATALAELFALDPDAVEAVTRVEGV